MNLHAIVAPLVGAINPPIQALIMSSTGYTTNDDGTRVPTYAPACTISCQVQALQYNDIAQLDGLNIQGIRRKAYLYGQWNGIIRADKKGGDLIQFPDGSIWLVAMVFEYWPDWVSVALTLQDGS